MSSSTAQEYPQEVHPNLLASSPNCSNYEDMSSHLKVGGTSATKSGPTKEKDTLALHFVAGSISGFLTRCVCQPFDVLKIRFQLQLDPITKNCDSAKYSGIKQACRLILKEEGITAFWKGNIPAQTLSIVYGGIQFYGFEYTKNTLYPNRNDLMSNFICGAVGGGMAMTIAHPLDVLRTRLVAQGEPKTYSGMFNAIVTMRRREGPLAFYKGFFSNILQVTPYNGACFSFYYLFRAIFDDIPYVPSNIASGALAGFAGKTLVYPFDLIKKRLQVQGFQDHTHKFGNYEGLVSCARSVFETEGPLGFFKGYVPSCMKAMAMSACQFTFYETAMFVLVLARQKRESSKQKELTTKLNLAGPTASSTTPITSDRSTAEKLDEKQK
ncbi:mitochondrial thiamine pyrophosphate carrier-like [Varroa jacobsoni]|uniref:Mitochondrial thiamine pyrophosphate carrier n=1 Tax=Varroa destructor TaxID=109461 RepID=A0A7M7JF39_VARDE|nr:mitochondrial thiamine pyrophosphate carrier-like isoform X1 [Varroa destructor]XP_022651149.1 mitochondrial thiamine pyrophosphate carrier-like isoform X1 [Varroa destructor]XP_022699857.1 mitochondrial thiamine pyrophosphate carrier-like [Varroa jacobsoni]XP_022699866.1 mitochondrial thiamine pyrophosphate carrier-like [Varroa jacobsoni]XP_022699871.1 mitochondrial thiamine pyrophosphate carrier-like [Varroa jacobsoni]